MNSTGADSANVGEAATDISFSNFVALDFDQQFELVATHHQSDRAANITQWVDDAREMPAAKRHNCSLDDSDGEAANESDGEVGFDLSALLNQAVQAPRLTQSEAAQGVEVVKPHHGQTCGRWN